MQCLLVALAALVALVVSVVSVASVVLVVFAFIVSVEVDDDQHEIYPMKKAK